MTERTRIARANQHRAAHTFPVPRPVNGKDRPGGAKLPEETRTFFEGRFDHDFSRVRVHTDDPAARAIGARAFTDGNDIVFAAGQYDPRGREGRRLLAHELAHVVQSPGVIARQGGSPFDSPESRRLRERALRYQPRLRPRVPRVPRIPEPQVPAEPPAPAPPARCPTPNQVRSELAAAGAIDATVKAMEYQVNRASAQMATAGVSFTPNLLATADAAIRRTFPGLIRRTPGVTQQGMTTVMPSADFARIRVPGQAEAEERVAAYVFEVASSQEQEARDIVAQAAQGTPPRTALPTFTTSLLHSLCIRNARDNNLLDFVVRPLIRTKGLQFVRDWQAARTGGHTQFPSGQAPHIDLPSRTRNLGHVVVHEAMHFYVHDRYRTVAEADTRRTDVLMEGGAEYLTRQVIHTRLSNDPRFRVNYESRSDQFQFVASHIARGGIDTFARAYFNGEVELIGLPGRPKLAMTTPGDAVEREADELASAALSGA